MITITKTEADQTVFEMHTEDRSTIVTLRDGRIVVQVWDDHEVAEFRTIGGR